MVYMKSKISLLEKSSLILLLSVMFSCSKDEVVPLQEEHLRYGFETGPEGWTGGFSDYPPGQEEDYELVFAYSQLPPPLNTQEGALKLSGWNMSDDLFMFIKKEIEGLKPNTEYSLSFKVEFASNVAKDMFGIGGSPGEGVAVKVGATAIEPQKILIADGDEIYRMNIDKGNQSTSGADMINIGNFANGTEENVYALKTVANESPFKVSTNAEGSLWLIVGTDSGFEGTTTIYYNKISVKVALE